MQVLYELEGVGRTVTSLRGIAMRLLDLEPAWLEVEKIWVRAEAAQFSRGQLVDSGRLMRSLTGIGDGMDAIREAHADEMVFGTAVPYARAAASKVGRPILLPPEKRKHEIAALTLEYVVRGV